ncbi:MAG: hypothetical protein WCX65_18180 [bacterium]
MTTKEKIIEAIGEIPDEKLNEFLSIVEDFKKKSATVKSGGKWSRFAGILTDEQAEAMLAVIEETCERIDND